MKKTFTIVFVLFWAISGCKNSKHTQKNGSLTELQTEIVKIIDVHQISYGSLLSIKDSLCDYKVVTDIKDLGNEIGNSGFHLNFSYEDTTQIEGAEHIIVVPVNVMMADCYSSDGHLIESHKYLGQYAFEHCLFSSKNGRNVSECDTIYPIPFYTVVVKP